MSVISNPNILVTGGTGFIGSHTLLELASAGYKPFVIDSGVNSSPPAVMQRVNELTGTKIPWHDVDLRNKSALERYFAERKTEGVSFNSVIHFAALKAVGESVEQPLKYYENNVGGTINLLDAMLSADIGEIVFSSSATVYGEPASLPITEDAPTVRPNSPYGETKLMMEWALQSVARAHDIKVTLLRYFNPMGAHSSGKLGEDPKGVPNNLFPIMMRIATGRLEKLKVYGNDWKTNKNGYKVQKGGDNTPVRDYIHIEDLARAHVLALGHAGIFNLGTGTGTTVLEMVAAFNKALGREIPIEIVGRRDGDVPELMADASKAARELSWKPQYSVQDATEHGVKFALDNPNGYEG